MAVSPPPIRIANPEDPRLNDIRDLNSSDRRPDRPGGTGLVIAEGLIAVPRLLSSRFPVRCVVGFGSRLRSLLDAGVPRQIPVYEVSRETLAECVGFDMHRGVVAAADRAPELPLAEVIRGARTLCVLEGVGDHENIGAIFRNAAGLAVDGILFGPGCADPLYRRSVRVSMGHVLRLPFAHLPGAVTTWQRSLGVLREAGFRLVSLTPSGTATLAEAVQVAGRPADKVAFFVGAEGPGLTEHAMRATDVRAAIPMTAGTDSLNVATAAAVAFYERVRRG